MKNWRKRGGLLTLSEHAKCVDDSALGENDDYRSDSANFVASPSKRWNKSHRGHQGAQLLVDGEDRDKHNC